MTEFQFDNNVHSDLLSALSELGHRITSAHQLDLTEAPDAVHLWSAARGGRIFVTRDTGFAPLNEAWHHWLVMPGSERPHAGIICVQPITAQLIQTAARRIDTALADGWDPTANLWLLNARLGWKRLVGRSSVRGSWSPFAESPLTLR